MLAEVLIDRIVIHATDVQHYLLLGIRQYNVPLAVVSQLGRSERDDHRLDSNRPGRRSDQVHPG